MQIRRYFTGRQGEAFSNVAFRRVSIAAEDAPAGFIFAPSTWPLGAIEAFATNALLKCPVPAARRQLYEAGIPPVLRRHRTLGEAERPHEPVERLETDVRDAIGRVCGGLTRHGLDHGYFSSPEDALAFHEELGAALLQRRITLSSEIWQRAGVSWAYDVSAQPAQKPVALQTYALSSDDFLTRITADARRSHDAAALALGRSSLADLTKAVKAALTDGGPNPAANTSLRDALSDAEQRGLPAAAAQRVVDECLGGDQSWPEADTHLDADSDVWSLLEASTPYVVRMTAACGDAGMEELALASFRGEAPSLYFETAGAHHSLSNQAKDIACATGNTGSPAFTPSAAVDLLSFTLALPDGAATQPSLDIDGLVHAVRLLTIALDIFVDSAAEEDRSAADARALAIQPLNLAAVVMSHGMGYGSDDGRALAASTSALVTATAIAASAQLARQLSPCPAFAANKDATKTFLGSMEDALLGRPKTPSHASGSDAAVMYPRTVQHARILDAARGILDRAKTDTAQSGLRNLSLTSIRDDADMAAMLASESTGIAPVRALIRHRHLTPDLDARAIYKVVSPAVPAGLRALHHDDASIDRMLDYMIGLGSLDGAPGVNHALLRERGFADEDIEITESALATAGDIRSVFTPYTLGWDAAVTGDDILSRLGFSDWDVDHANLYCCGALTLEGSRDLPAEHLPVFECDEPLGTIGTRHVSVIDRMRMAQAIQPFVTDDLTLDICVPQDTDIDGIRGFYQQAKAMALSSIRLNRTGTDLSAPIAYDDVLDGLTEHCAPEEQASFAENIYVHSMETDDMASAQSDMIDQNAALAVAISVGLKHGIPIEAFQDAFTALSPTNGTAVLNDALAKLAGSFIDPGADSDAASHALPQQEQPMDYGRTGHSIQQAHSMLTSTKENQNLGFRADVSASNPSQAFGDTAFSPPSVSGQSREE